MTATTSRPPTRVARALRAVRRRHGEHGRSRWERPALAALLVLTAALYVWNLSASGYANDFYAAAVQAGTQNWKAWLFGSLDAGNAITVDKPPAALWLMVLSARILGFGSWSLLLPQALAGVASVGVLYATVRRWHGAVAGLVAGGALALTPVAALMFRFDNPDALLVLLLVTGAYCTVRAVERASARWLMLAGVAVGFGFLTKMMQAFLVLPAFALVYLLAAPTRLRTRLLHLLAAGAALVVSAGWYVALVELWPASSRPYVGGSTGNSLLQLALGYNGLSRIFGGAPGGGGGGGASRGGGGGGGPVGAGGFGGEAGLTRLFGSSMGLEISWLLPAALLALVAGLWLSRRGLRTDRTRASTVLWGGWLLVTGLVFSFMSGIVHPYYTVALAPAIGALLGIAGTAAWRERDRLVPRSLLAAMIGGTAVWTWVLLGRVDRLPALRWVVLVAGVVTAVLLAVGGRRFRRLAVAVVLAGVLSAGLGTGSYAVATAATAHGGTIPSSGPQGVAVQQAGPGGKPGGGPVLRGGPGRTGEGPGGDPGGDPGGGPRRLYRPGGGPGGGGPGGGVTASSALTALLKKSDARWAAATTGSQGAASLELASGTSVMAIGGFSGGDAYPTLAQFQAYVTAGDVAYYVAGAEDGGRTGGPGGSTGSAARIAGWVKAHYRTETVGGTTVYDLRAQRS